MTPFNLGLNYMSRNYPLQLHFNGHQYEVERILKDDFYSVNVLYKSNDTHVRYVLKLSDFRFIFGKLLRPFAMFMSWREYQIYRKVANIPGVPPLGPRMGSRGYFHEYIAGKTLFEIKRDGLELPKTFFDELRHTIDEIHKRDICYVDLNKLGNMICGDDGKAYLIDYQISLEVPKFPVVGSLLHGLFEQLKREDLYHLYKHKSRFLPELTTTEELNFAKKSGFNLLYDRVAGKPWRWFKRLLYPHGSNEIIWYKWRKMQESNHTDMEMP